MVALSSTGLAQGLQTGLGIARQYKMDERNEQRYQQGLERDERRYQDQLAAQAEDRRLQAIDRQNTAAYRSDMLANQAAQTKAARDRAAFAQEVSEAELFNLERARRMPEAAAYLRGVGMGVRDVDLNFETEVLDKYDLREYKPSNWADGDYLEAIGRLRNKADYVLQSGDYASINTDSQFLADMQTVYGQRIRKGVGEKTADGKVITDKVIDGFQVAPNGKFVINVATFYDDNSSEVMPVTQMRSSDPNDPVVAHDAGTMIDQIYGMSDIANIMISSDVQANIAKGYQTATGAKPTNQERPASPVQQIQYLTGELGVDEDRAISLVYGAKANPLKAVTDLAQILVDAGLSEGQVAITTAARIMGYSPQQLQEMGSSPTGSNDQGEEQGSKPVDKDEAWRAMTGGN